MDQDYLDARAAWVTHQTLDKTRTQAVEREAAQAEASVNQARKSGLAEIIDAGKTRYKDFEDIVVKGADKWSLTEDVFDLAIMSEHGSDVLYHLAGNPAEASRIAGLTPTQRGVEFARLEARFSHPSKSDPPAEAKPATQIRGSNAPTPPASKARGAGTGKPKIGNMDFAAFEAYVNAAEKA